MPNTIRIERDADAESPRCWDNLWHIAGWHGRYNIGDEQPAARPAEHLKSLPKNSLVVPLYMYDHSGITIATTPFSCPFDSGQAGHCWVTGKEITQEYGKDTPENRQKALEVLQGEVKSYDMYLKNDCWQFSIEDEDGNHVDGCCGFFGDDIIDNGMIEHVDLEDFDAFIAAAREAGMTADPRKIDECKARAVAHQMNQETATAGAARSIPRV